MSDAARKRLILLIAAGVTAVIAFWCIVEWRADDYYIAKIVRACRVSGYGALGCLLVSLCASPLARLAAYCGRSSFKPLSLDVAKLFGGAAALLALLHGVVALLTYVQNNWAVVIERPYLRSGLLALIILVLLGLTSSQTIVHWIRLELWKPLHRLSYFAALLVLHHLLLSPFGPRRWILLVYAVFAVVQLCRLLPNRVRDPSASARATSRPLQPERQA